MTSLFEREEWHLLRTLDGVAQTAGCRVPELPWVVMKELADNACDAAGGCQIHWPTAQVFAVSDTGEGIQGTDEELAALFSPGRALRSSKLLRKPTRGAMGNGLRVVVGAVLASGGKLRVATRGRCLSLQPQDDGTTRILSTAPAPVIGTTITVQLGQALTPWLHVARAEQPLLTALVGDGAGYQGKSSPWWYDSDAFRELLQASPATVREIVASLEGLSGATAGAVAAKYKGREARSLTQAETEDLLAEARSSSRRVKPERLGTVGRLGHLPTGYAKEVGEVEVRAARGRHHACVPFVIEAWADPVEGDKYPSFSLFTNRSPVIATHGVWKERNDQWFHGCGLRFDVSVGRTPMRVLLNISAPYFRRTDHGKAPDLSNIASKIKETVATAIRRAKRANPAALAVATQRDCITESLPAAIEHAGGGLPFNIRQLFYSVRPRLLAAGFKEPDYNYFSKIVAEHENEHGRIALMTRDPRGILYHPHTGEEIPVGTVEVDRYVRPPWTFNAVLYIEKEGLISTLRALKWPERNDIALMTSKGQASGAAKDLIDFLGGDDEMTFFCLHDADGPGTMIYQSLQEETRARPKRKVQIINLGLDPDDAVAMGLQSEPVESKGRVPVANYIEPRWAEWLQSNRVELNAMTTNQFVAWLDRKIAEKAPYRPRKVVPPTPHLQKTLASEVRGGLLTKLQNQAILEARCEEHAEKAMVELAPTLAEYAPTLADVVAAELANDPGRLWLDVVAETAQKIVGAIK